jgi:hypothetical protein
MCVDWGDIKIFNTYAQGLSMRDLPGFHVPLSHVPRLWQVLLYIQQPSCPPFPYFSNTNFKRLKFRATLLSMWHSLENSFARKQFENLLHGNSFPPMKRFSFNA